LAKSFGVLKKIPISFTEDQYDWLQQESFKRKISIAAIVRELLLVEMEKKGSQPRLV
jgi:hypothetical protein